jgi:TldD protein
MLLEIQEKIKNLSADYGEIHFEVYTTNRISYSKDNIEAVQTSKTSAGNVRALVKGGWGFASFNDMDFDKSIRYALENAKLVSSQKKDKISTIILNNKPVIDSIKTGFEISPASYTLEQKNDLVRRYNEGLKHPGIASTRVTYTDWTVQKYFFNTEGAAIDQTKTFTGVSYGAMAKDGTNVQQAFESIGQYGGMELVINLENKVETVKKRALDLLKASKIESGQYQVLLDPNLAGVFAHEAFGHLSEADFLYENPRMQDVMVLGREFGPEILNIIDDGGIVNLAGYTPYDDEGIKAEKSYLIRNGRLSARLHSRETAAKMNEGVSGNARAVSPAFQPIVRMTNTYIDNGVRSFQELLSSIKDGIYAVDYLGGMTNLEMFTFSAGYAYRIRNGEIKELLRDVVLSGNVFSTLGNITAVGNDIKHHGGLGGCGKAGQSGLPVSTGSPHIIIKDVLIGGV